uniref:T. congolense-specific, cell surface-expressed gene family n=1 Tax=Trypanosoma congolense (strain IL3000) TaxID=1068625 RepID=G0UM18_TRYCI|nr:hypothetical protein, unlikely [Trypanosoma congolense IL3000]
MYGLLFLHRLLCITCDVSCQRGAPVFLPHLSQEAEGGNSLCFLAFDSARWVAYQDEYAHPQSIFSGGGSYFSVERRCRFLFLFCYYYFSRGEDLNAFCCFFSFSFLMGGFSDSSFHLRVRTYSFCLIERMHS